MQQWSKDYIESRSENFSFCQLKYAQQSYCLHHTGIYFMHPIGFEICRNRLIERKLLTTQMFKMQDVIVNDHSWVKYIPKDFPAGSIDGLWMGMLEAAMNDNLFQRYGGY
jgi:hypothetical protein